MNTTRRKFLGMLGAATAMGGTTAFAFAEDTEFREPEPDRVYYFVKFNGTKFTEEGRLGKDWSRTLEDCLRNFEQWDYLERVFEGANARHMRLVPDNINGLNDDDPGKIDITEAWLREFWRRHGAWQEGNVG